MEIRFFRTTNWTGSDYWSYTSDRDSIPAWRKNQILSFKVIKNEPFENKLSLYNYDNTNNYILALLIIIGFFYARSCSN